MLLSTLKQHTPEHDIYFHQGASSLNQMDYEKLPYSKVMPVECLGSPFINFLLKRGKLGEETYTYVTFTQEELSEDSLSNYIFIAKERTAKIASSYGVGFYDYYKDDHEGLVNLALRKHNLTQESVKVFNFKPNFRNLNDE